MDKSLNVLPSQLWVKWAKILDNVVLFAQVINCLFHSQNHLLY